VKGSAYTVFFSAALGTACALLLTAAASFTKPYQEANKLADEARNILEALKVPRQEGASWASAPSAEAVEAREEKVKEKKLGDLTTYVYEVNGQTKATAMRFEGPGLWGPVKGFLALETDMKTIRGMTIYQQEETPGLGGEIGASWFRDQFVGKSILDAGGNPGIIINMATEEAINKVDGISGATMTCDKVQAMLNEAIKRIVEEKQ
jgi:Na+-transporting NADH:ubiquinone oxidoreductase subunit C